MQNSRRIFSQSKASYWREAIRSWQQSSKSQVAFCRERRLALSTFTYWHKRLAKTEVVTPHFYPLVASNSAWQQRTSPARLRFLVRGERFSVPLFDMLEPEVEPVAEKVEVPGHSRKNSGRKKLPDSLPRVGVIHDTERVNENETPLCVN